MLTDQETLKQKKTILQDISKIYEGLLKTKKISDEEAGKILEAVKTKLVAESHDLEFSENVMAFCKEYPAFKDVADKVNNNRHELIEKLGQECLEKIMDEDTDTWSKLTTTLEGMNEMNLHQWFASLPETSRVLFLNKFLSLSTSVI